MKLSFIKVMAYFTLVLVYGLLCSGGYSYAEEQKTAEGSVDNLKVTIQNQEDTIKQLQLELKKQQEKIDSYFHEVVFPVLTPLAFDPGHRALHPHPAAVPGQDHQSTVAEGAGHHQARLPRGHLPHASRKRDLPAGSRRGDRPPWRPRG